MFTIDPREARVLAAERARSLRDDFAAQRLAARSTRRVFVGASLRCAARRLAPATAFASPA